MEPSKKDWKLYREKVPGWQENYMERLIEDYVSYLSSTEPASTKFWTMEKRMKQDKKTPGVCIEIRNRNLANKKSEITIHSSAAEYLTYVASVGDQADSFEMRYEAENIWRQWAYRGCNYPEIPDSSNRRFSSSK